MQKLVWQNANGVELDLTSGNYGITEWEGFSNASLNIQSQQVPFQDGGVFLDALIEQRELSVTLAMQDNNNLELRYQQRRELISALNPKLGEGYLIYTNDYTSKRIKCIPQIPLFENHNSNDTGTPKASLSWTACEPYWEDLEDTVVEISSGVQVTTIQNNGDVVIGFEATAFMGGKKVYIENQQGKQIELLTDYPFPELDINTNVGKKTITGKGIFDLAGINCTITGQISFSGFVIKRPFIKIENYYYGFAYNYSDTYFIRSSDLINWEQVGSLIPNTTMIINTNQFALVYNKYNNKIYALTPQEKLAVSSDYGQTWTTTSVNYTSMCVNEKTGDMFFSDKTESACIYNPLTEEVAEFYNENQQLVVKIYRESGTITRTHNYNMYNLKIYYNSKNQYLLYQNIANDVDYLLLNINGEKAGHIQNIGGHTLWENEDGYYVIGDVPYSDNNSYVVWLNKDLTDSQYGVQSFPHFVSSDVVGKELLAFDNSSNNPQLLRFPVKGTDNFISNLTSNSDMSLGLEIGQNTITTITEYGMSIKYRQKYIGV